MVILETDWWVRDAAVNGVFLGVSEVLSVQDLPEKAIHHCRQQRRFLMLNQSWLYLFF